MAKVRRGGKVIYVSKAQYQYIKGYAQLLGLSQGTVASSPAYANQFGTQQQQDDDTQQTPIAPSDVLQSSATTLNAFTSGTADEQVNAITYGTSDSVPNFLSDSPFQRFMYNNEYDGKPQIVSDSALDAMKGQDLYRTVNSVYDKKTDVGYSGKEIAQQLQYGDFTRFSDTGGLAYGKGLYFSNDYNGSKMYGNTTGNVNKTAMVRCKLNSNAKMATYSSMSSNYQSDLRRGDKVAKAIDKACGGDHKSAVSMYSLSKGINVLTSSTNTNASDTYFNILDRSVLTMSADVKATGRKWK